MGDSAIVTSRPEAPSETELAGSAAAQGAFSAASDEIDIRVPAKSAYVSMVRTMTANVAARASFTLDEIEDLRIAVDEACALLLSQSVEGGALLCTFGLESDGIRITAKVESTTGEVPARDTFGWTVLTALAGEVDAGYEDGSLWVSLHKLRTAQPSEPAS